MLVGKYNSNEEVGETSDNFTDRMIEIRALQARLNQAVHEQRILVNAIKERVARVSF